MEFIESKYGDIFGVSRIEEYEDGSVKECLLEEENVIKTPYGNLVPRYEQSSVRDKYNKSIAFYANGNMKSIALQKASVIKTKYGEFEAELITFYESGHIKKLFPLNGKLTGYWEEEQELELAKTLAFELDVISVKHKCISLSFYESGNIKAITLWQGELFKFERPEGLLYSRIGAKFFETSELMGIEPAYPSLILTPIGSIFAYDSMAVGIHSDNPSLKFSKDKQVVELKTSTDHIEILGPSGVRIMYKPKLIPNMMNPEELETQALLINFEDGIVRFNNSVSHEYCIKDVTINVIHKAHSINGACSSCSSCSGNCDG